METLREPKPDLNQSLSPDSGDLSGLNHHVLFSDENLISGRSGGSIKRDELPQVLNFPQIEKSLIGAVAQEGAELINQVESDPQTQTAIDTVKMSGMQSFSSGPTGSKGSYDDVPYDVDPSSD